MTARPIVFAGCSVRSEVRAQYAELLDFREPVKRGDLDAVIAQEDRPAVVGVVDGVFMQALALPAKEMIRLLDAGVDVYGSSSMGALRAAECAPFGAVAVGAIAAMYRDGWLFGDDEVAMTYLSDGCPGSVPLVNVRFAVHRAHQEGVVDAAMADELIACALARYFPELSYERIVRDLGDDRGTEFLAWIRACRPDQKQADAEELLASIAAHGAMPDHAAVNAIEAG